MDSNIFGPFENGDEISERWYEYRISEIEESINEIKKDLEDKHNSKQDIEGYLNDLAQYGKELDSIRSVRTAYVSCLEKYKFNKRILSKVVNRWQEYNISLYSDYCNIQALIIGGPQGRSLEEIQEELRTAGEYERSKRSDIKEELIHLSKQ